MSFFRIVAFLLLTTVARADGDLFVVYEGTEGPGKGKHKVEQACARAGGAQGHAQGHAQGRTRWRARSRTGIRAQGQESQTAHKVHHHLPGAGNAQGGTRP